MCAFDVSVTFNFLHFRILINPWRKQKAKIIASRGVLGPNATEYSILGERFGNNPWKIAAIIALGGYFFHLMNHVCYQLEVVAKVLWTQLRLRQRTTR